MDYMALYNIFIGHPYVFLFIGMFFLGETILLPAIYISFQGGLNPAKVILICTIATLIADLVWYYLASSVPVGKLKKWDRIAKHQDTFATLSGLFDKHNTRILFLSKFVYGTRILVQIICGMRKMNIGLYLGVNILGIITYILIAYVIAAAVNITMSARLISDIRIAIIIFVIIVIGINLVLKYFIQRKWFQ
jgi:membrane protein DedA with SNARE-associated domain